MDGRREETKNTNSNNSNTTVACAGSGKGVFLMCTHTHTQLQTEILKKKNGLRAENEKNNKQIHVGFLDILCICEIIATYLIVTRRDISATRLP